MTEMEIALELLGVGMVTVFLILSLVVLLGNSIIWFVNRFIPEFEKATAVVSENLGAKQDPRKIAVIVSAVNKVTNGAARVTKIEKL
jgi:oxaloacetate decarboxylase (Na+ extruding) subunit gamma